MAKEEVTSPAVHDVTAHVQDYARFTAMFKWGAIICFIIAMALLFFVL